jgi:hypothetical protein
VRIAHKWKYASSERGQEEARALFFLSTAAALLRQPPLSRSRTLGTDPDLLRLPEIPRPSHRHPRQAVPRNDHALAREQPDM